MVGLELQKYLAKDALFFSHEEEPKLDILDFEKTREIIVAFCPDLIVHLAADTDVDWCQQNPEECLKTNLGGTQNLVKIAKEINAVFVYPSTFYVYGGEKIGPYDDRVDFPELDNIASVYAKSKFLGEEVIRTNLKKFFILRLGALFGGGKKDKKFVSKIINLAKTNKEIKVVRDRIVQPSSIRDTVNNLLALIQTDKYDTYNMVGHGSASYYEYAKAILEYAGFRDAKVIPIPSADFREDAPRKKNLSVINGKLQDIGLDLMRDWKIALKDYIDELKREELIEYE